MDKHLPNHSAIAETLKSIGFVDADQRKDFGMVISGLIYLRRVHSPNNHQYVWLCHYEGKFLEAGFQVYFKEFNSVRAKGNHKQRDLELSGHVPMFGLIYRSLQELLEAASKTYEPSPVNKSGGADKTTLARVEKPMLRKSENGS